MSKFREFIKFIVKVYIRSLFESRKPVKSAFNDLTKIKTISQYKEINAKISDAALTKFMKHLWYQSEPLVAMAFFDDRFNADEKRDMVVAFNKESLGAK